MKNNEHPCANEWLALNDYGFSIFPLTSGQKTPIGSWKQYQTDKPSDDELAEWLTSGKNHNVGIATGAVSGIVVLDLDSPDAESFAKRQGLPDTPEVKTPRGRHLYYRHPGFDIRNTAGKLADKIDFRGDGGYVVGPGSYFIPNTTQAFEGKVEGAYEWVEGRTPADMAFADLPGWAIPAPEPFAPSAPLNNDPRPIPTSRAEAYGLRGLADECEAIRSAPNGQRNHQLNASAFAVSQLVAGGLVEPVTARQEVETAALMAGLSNSEIKLTIDSAWKAGAKSPRLMPDDSDTVKQSPTVPAAPAASLEWFSATVASQATVKEREWLIDGWLPVGATTLLTGDGGTGKTLIAQQMATAIATGQPLWGNDTTQAPVLGFYCEDDRDELNRRQRSINGSMGLVPNDVVASHMASEFGMSALLGSIDKQGAFQTNDLFASIRAKALDAGARLVVIDNINMVFGDDINAAGPVSRFMSALNRLALEINGAVLMLGHVAKAEGSRSAGTAAWVNGARNHLFLGRPDNMTEAAKRPDVRHLVRNKSNYASTGERLELMWERGAFIAAADLTGNARTLDDVADDKWFLSLLDRHTASREALSISPRAANYAPKVMSKTGSFRDAKGTRKMEQAMGRLLSAGTILPDELLGWQKANRHEARGIKRADTNPLTMEKTAAMDFMDQLRGKAPTDTTPAAPPSLIVRATPPTPDFERSDKVAAILQAVNAKRGIQT